MAKLNEYYERTAASDAHIIVMSACVYLLLVFHIVIIVPVLDPTLKLKYFKKHWGSELLEKVKLTVKALVCFFIPHFLPPVDM